MEFDYLDTVLEFTGYFHAETSGVYVFQMDGVDQGAAAFLGSNSLLGCCSEVDWSLKESSGLLSGTTFDNDIYLMSVIPLGNTFTNIVVCIIIFFSHMTFKWHNFNSFSQFPILTCVHISQISIS
ncbi:unnamed protein product [Ambrosiozyma monospora]|uniref:Unnamed protein product n=1 Tax=Ambrosiozyma monospora TaxID=43982 RepID=A0ACB5UDB3_AMBMO|nr:unnamed protein product [Ambrosiozyma monospora]